MEYGTTMSEMIGLMVAIYLIITLPHLAWSAVIKWLAAIRSGMKEYTGPIQVTNLEVQLTFWAVALVLVALLLPMLSLLGVLLIIAAVQILLCWLEYRHYCNRLYGIPQRTCLFFTVLTNIGSWYGLVAVLQIIQFIKELFL